MSMACGLEARVLCDVRVRLFLEYSPGTQTLNSMDRDLRKLTWIASSDILERKSLASLDIDLDYGKTQESAFERYLIHIHQLNIC